MIFGHSLSEQDQHLIDAINTNRKRPLAVSVADKGASANRRRMLEVHRYFPDSEIYFFNALRSPLGTRGCGWPAA